MPKMCQPSGFNSLKKKNPTHTPSEIKKKNNPKQTQKQLNQKKPKYHTKDLKAKIYLYNPM